jgi:plastocyanin
LGTTPILLSIGLSSVKFSSRPHLANHFLKVAGTLILFFALFNINSQLNVLGWPSLTDSFSKTNAKLNTNSIDSSNTNDQDLPPIVNGQQIIKMEASAYGYSPDYFKVRAGLPVRWEITDTGTSGCTNAVLSRSLFDGQIELTPGQTSIKEFTPQKPGKYKFSCWMGMISGVIEVVDAKNNNNSYSNNDGGGATAPIVPSGAKGCGCGGGGSGSCSQPQ